MSSIFLSHNHKDKAFVRKLADRLNSHGIRTWVDEAEIRVGDSLITKIEAAIKDFAYLGVILSPNSVNSQWVRKEVNIALTQEIDGAQVKVLPILIETCKIPGFLSDKLYADFTTDFEDGFVTLLERLRDDLYDDNHKSKKAWELFQQSYQTWVSFGKPDHLLLNSEYIDIILKHIPYGDFSIELFEFMACSISLSESSSTEFLARTSLFFQSQRKIIPAVLGKLLKNPNPRISGGAISILETIDNLDTIQEFVNLFDTDLINKINKGSIHKFIRLVQRKGVELRPDLALGIVAANKQDPDWFCLSYCTRKLELKMCLLIGDGTDFAQELGKMAEGAGYILINLPIINAVDLNAIDADIIGIHKLIILVRGQIFDQAGSREFYAQLEQYVENGGILFGTSFVGWETRANLTFNKILPFNATKAYEENMEITCRLSESSPIKGFSTAFTLLTTYEILVPSVESITFLETEKLPIFGYKPFGNGHCYYLNMCQHWCRGVIQSPFKASGELSKYFSNFFTWLFESSSEVKK
jgi:hypothetical protein